MQFRSRTAEILGKAGTRVQSLGIVPTVTFALVAFNAIVFAVEEMSGGPNQTAVLIKLGALDSGTFTQYEYYRILVAPFLHVSLVHLTSNMVALLFVGWALEKAYGGLRFAVVYFTSAFVGSFLSAILIPNGVVVVGASGAIVGCFLSLLVLQFRFKFMHTACGFGPKMTLFLVTCIILSGFLPSSGIDNVAHVGGVMGGSIIGLLVSPPIGFMSRMQAQDTTLQRILRKSTKQHTIPYGWTHLRLGLTLTLVIIALFGTVSSALYPRLQISVVNFSLQSSALDGSVTIQVVGNGLFVPEAATVMLGQTPLIVQIETNQTILHLPGELELHVMGVGSTASDTLTIAIGGVWAAFGTQVTTPVYITVEQSINWGDPIF